LTADHVPFAFITGYGAEEIEPRYSSVPILQKPIEVSALEAVFARPQTRAGGAAQRMAG
jgi:hypothetical protein